MFFKKAKKEKQENETINNAVFGELEYIDCAWEGYSVSSLFGEEKTIDLYVYADEDEKTIGEHQEKVYQNYLRNRIEIEDAVRKVIFREFKLPYVFDLNKVILCRLLFGKETRRNLEHHTNALNSLKTLSNCVKQMALSGKQCYMVSLL